MSPKKGDTRCDLPPPPPLCYATVSSLISHYKCMLTLIIQSAVTVLRAALSFYETAAVVIADLNVSTSSTDNGLYPVPGLFQPAVYSDCNEFILVSSTPVPWQASVPPPKKRNNALNNGQLKSADQQLIISVFSTKRVVRFKRLKTVDGQPFESATFIGFRSQSGIGWTTTGRLEILSVLRSTVYRNDFYAHVTIVRII
ncbi:hypothetical protein J6590_087792 [Homalodisca vitripennis]|nr:hypothetical protein J6590_087792 [Homalodisca vitripennis]